MTEGAAHAPGPLAEQQEEAVEEDLYIGDGDFIDGEEDEDINFVSYGEGLDEETNKFDQVVGVLSDILLDAEFEELRDSFCRQHCTLFEDNDENKLEYTDVFARYTQLVEATIEARLKAAVHGFDMASFMGQLHERRDELMSDVFDLLLSLGDFETFKELMLAYKQEQQQQGSMACGFHIQVCPVHVHMEEQEDGEERPDLDCSLNISPVGSRPRPPPLAA